jgi:hypothetical protein
MRVGDDLEGEEVLQVELPDLLQTLEQPFRMPGEAQVQVSRRAGTGKTKLEDHPALQRGSGPEAVEEAGQEALEDHQLPEALERTTGGQGFLLEPGFESHLEADRGGVSHRDPFKWSSSTSAWEKSPRASPVAIACCTSSGETEAPRQSWMVRSGLVTGTGPDQVRSRAGTEPRWRQRPWGTTRRRSAGGEGRVMCT